MLTLRPTLKCVGKYFDYNGPAMYILSMVDVAKAKGKKKECPNGTHIILAFQNKLFNYK